MKDFIKSKITYIVIIVLLVICVKMFVSNYSFQQPIISKHQPSYNDLLGEVAGLQSAAAISANDAAIYANNPDLK